MILSAIDLNTSGAHSQPLRGTDQCNAALFISTGTVTCLLFVFQVWCCLIQYQPCRQGAVITLDTALCLTLRSTKTQHCRTRHHTDCHGNVMHCNSPVRHKHAEPDLCTRGSICNMAVDRPRNKPIPGPWSKNAASTTAGVKEPTTQPKNSRQTLLVLPYHIIQDPCFEPQVVVAESSACISGELPSITGA